MTLQDKMNQLRKRQEERNQMPPDVAGLDQEFQQKEKTVAELRERSLAAIAEKSDLDRQLDEQNGKLTKYQTQLMSVRTNKEYSAALNEIDTARKEVKSLEDRILALQERLESDEAELTQRESALPGEKSSFEERIAGWRSFQATCDAEILEISEEIGRIEKEIPKALGTQLKQIFARRGGLAVVRVTSPSCGGCNVRLRPALFQTLKLRSEKEIITCENCKRILFFDADAAGE